MKEQDATFVGVEKMYREWFQKNAIQKKIKM